VSPTEVPKGVLHAGSRQKSEFRDSMVDTDLPELKTGPMEKLSTGALKRWHKRHWVMNSKYLRYWETTDDAAENADPKCVIALASIAEVVTEANGEIMLKLEARAVGTVSTAVVKLRTSSVHEGKQWALALHEAVKDAKGDRTPAPLPTAPTKVALQCAAAGCIKWKLGKCRFCKDHLETAQDSGSRKSTKGGSDSSKR
jgi:hypothetical protein